MRIWVPHKRLLLAMAKKTTAGKSLLPLSPHTFFLAKSSGCAVKFNNFTHDLGELRRSGAVFKAARTFS